MADKKQLGVPMLESDHAEFKSIAKSKGTTMTQIAKFLIQSYISKEKNKNEQKD